VTIDYVGFEDALQAWLLGVTGLPKVFWEERDRINEAELRYWGLLNVLSDVNLGVDDVRYTPVAGAPPPGEDMDEQVAGQRLVTVSVRVKSRSQQADQTARYFLSKARTSLGSPLVREQYLQPFQIAVVRMAAFANLDFTEQRRRVSLSSMDVTFHTVAERVAQTTYIETVEVTSSYKDAEGNPIPSSLQLDDTPLP